MKHNTIILLLGVLSIVRCDAQNINITFQVQSASTLARDEAVHVAGNQRVLGNWDASAVQLKKSGEWWTGTFAFPKGTHLEYKFTKGSWETEALTQELRVPPNYQFDVRSDTTLRYSIPAWRDSMLNTTPEITGEYVIHEEFPVKGLESRRVVVWLPPSYQQEQTRRFPVLYMHDGQNVFDPHTSTLGYDWRVDEVADSLISAGKIEEFICVAVYCNPGVRGQEYSDDPNLGEKYQDFMCCQLKPWIDSVYRTEPSPEHTAVMGSSMGGLISFILAWEYPTVFSKAACLSPAFKFQQYGFNIDYVEDVESTKDRRDIQLYLDNGTVDLEQTLQPGIDEMMQVLDRKGYQYTWYQDLGAPHNEIAWSHRVWRPLLLFFGK